MKKHIGFILFFTTLILIFFWKILSMKSAFLNGDYAVQFYPWSMAYSESIKAFQFPFWTRDFQSGFPLMAEGQVGGFYPLNMLFFFFLPFRVAYNYIVVFHFILAGIFTYMYTRKLGGCQWGGALAALLFCFGSAYAGCFYNTVTVKTLIWLPLVLLLFESYFDNKKPGYVIAAGFILGMQFLAGFAQLAVYSALFYVVYFTYGLAVRKDLKFKDIIVGCTGFFIAAVMFMPQFILSWQLAKLSGRADASLGFALWGSFAPLNFMSIVFPSWIFTGTKFYIGVLSLLFLFTAFSSLKVSIKIRAIFVVLLLSFFLAIGKYNPLYVLVLKALNFYSFRNPSKFLFFGMFAASSLAGVGFTWFFREYKSMYVKKAVHWFSIFISTMVGLFFIIKTGLKFFGDQIIRLGNWYASNYVYGQEHHRYDLLQYIDKVKSFYTVLVKNASLKNPYIILALGFCMIAIAFSVYIKRKGKIYSWHKTAFISLILVDIYVFSLYGTGFRGNIMDFEMLRPQTPKLFDIVDGDKEIFRILPYGIASGKLPKWSRPNVNAIYRIDSTGAYTPLVLEAYYKRLKSLEVVDNSLGLLHPADNSLKENKELLQFLNVKYIVSSEQMTYDFLEELGHEEGVYLYRLNGTLPRGYMIKALSVEADILQEAVEVIHYGSGYAKFSVKTETDGFFIFSESKYPGWQAKIDGESVRIDKFQDILMAIPLLKGEHEVIFEFIPFEKGEE